MAGEHLLLGNVEACCCRENAPKKNESAWQKDEPPDACWRRAALLQDFYTGPTRRIGSFFPKNDMILSSAS
jgi:hypothetical protein